MGRAILIAIAAVLALMVVGVLAAAALVVPVSRETGPASGSSSGLLQAASFRADTPALQAGITVTGEGSVTVKPDVARVTLGVQVSNPSAAAAQDEAAAKMSSVMAELTKSSIAQKDIQTVRFDLSPEYDYSSRTAVLKGYRVTNLVVVTVRDISKVGGLLDAVVASGATSLQGISFSVSDAAAAGSQGREEAMKNARAKADQLARLAGVSLGQPVAIEETVSAPPTPVEIGVRAAPEADQQTPISPGTQEVRTMVRVTYSIK